MKTFALPFSGHLPQTTPVKQTGGQLHLATLEKLSDLTHRFQHLLRYRPKGMSRLLPYYHYFLTLKENLERSFTCHQEASPSLAGPEADTAETRLQALRRRIGERSAPLDSAAREDLKQFSPALFSLFRELEILVMQGCVSVHQVRQALPNGLRPIGSPAKGRKTFPVFPGTRGTGALSQAI